MKYHVPYFNGNTHTTINSYSTNHIHGHELQKELDPKTARLTVTPDVTRALISIEKVIDDGGTDSFKRRKNIPY
jgi:hypothetical protein